MPGFPHDPFISTRRIDGVVYIIDPDNVAHEFDPDGVVVFPGEFRYAERTCVLAWDAKEGMFYIDRSGGAIRIPLTRVVDLWIEPSRLTSRENALEVKVRQGSSDEVHRLTEPKKQGRLDEVARTLFAAWRRPSPGDIAALDEEDEDEEDDDSDEWDDDE